MNYYNFILILLFTIHCKYSTNPITQNSKTQELSNSEISARLTNIEDQLDSTGNLIQTNNEINNVETIIELSTTNEKNKVAFNMLKGKYFIINKDSKNSLKFYEQALLLLTNKKDPVEKFILEAIANNHDYLGNFTKSNEL